MNIKQKTQIVSNKLNRKKLNNYIYEKILSNENFQTMLYLSVYNIIKNKYPCEIIQDTDSYEEKIEVFDHINPYEIYNWDEFLKMLIVKKKTTKAISKVDTVRENLGNELKIFFTQKDFLEYTKNFLEENNLKIEDLIERKPISKKKHKLKEFSDNGYDIENLPLLLTKTEEENFILQRAIHITVFSFLEKSNYDVLELYKKACEIQNIPFNIEKPKPLEYKEEDAKLYYKIFKEEYYKEYFSNDELNKNTLSELKVSYLKEKIDFYSEKQVFFVLNTCYSLFKSNVNLFDDKNENIDFLIQLISKLNAMIYFCEKIPDSLNDIFKYKATRKEILTHNVLSIFKYIFIDEKTKDEISKLVNFDPKYNFPETRKMRRHFVIHSGGTNTGKTYDSIQKLMKSSTGVYLAPLRLLALENQETMLSKGVLCSLSTGEEEDIVPNATHISSTVEKANYTKKYDLCVIDECQMIGDRDRGWAWTDAILGMQAPEIHLCTAPIAVELLIKIINDCGDTYEIIEHERVTPLIVENENIFSLKDVKPGDALICFSKKKVLNVSSALAKENTNCSIIYGALPYATRKKQFERFLNKEAEVVVSTDAIAMGLNLPIKRIIFLDTEKFDGQKVRNLTPEEIKQIAGRAGRRGIYEEGFVNSFKSKKMIRKALSIPSKQVKRAKINFPESLTEIDKDLIDTVKVWATLSNYNIYEKTDITRLVYILEQLRDFDLTKKEKLKLASIPFQETDPYLLKQWKAYIKAYQDGDVILNKPEKSYLASGTKIDILELYYRKLDLYFSFAKNMNMEIDTDWLAQEKATTAELINKELIEDLEKYNRHCSVCGKVLPWDFMFNVCEKCYSKNYRYYDEDWD